MANDLALYDPQRQIDDLAAEVRRLHEANRTLKAENEKLRVKVDTVGDGIVSLRNILAPLHVALKRVFAEPIMAELQYQVREPTPHFTHKDPRMETILKEWREKLPGMPALMLTQLENMGSMTAASLRMAMKCRQQTVYDTASKLMRAGVVVKDGNKYKLKTIE